MADWQRYLASLPERTVRAAAALGGGAAREVSDLALPSALRGTKLYQATVARLLRIIVEGVGGVGGVYPPEVGAMSVRELTTRKAAGNVVEFASILAIGSSPLWWLAAAADVSGGSRAYLRALIAELAEAKLLPAETDVSSFEGLLTELETRSGTLADAVDVPPLNLADARTAWDRLRQAPGDLPGPDDLASLFDALQAAARREGRSLSEVSAAVGLAAARAGWELGTTHVVDYYRDALGEINREGLLTFLRRIARPYLGRAGRHFLPATPTYTDQALAWAGDRLDRRRVPHPSTAADLPDGPPPPPRPLPPPEPDPPPSPAGIERGHGG